jgi:DeoR/GlpR family transcriptional regulator of sugar metabolism
MRIRSSRSPAMGKVASRHRALMHQLAAEGTMTVEALSDALAVAPATIRRDLQRLAASRRVVRTYGGAALPGAPTLGIAPEDGAKLAIARRAAGLLRDGETVVITGGSTTLALARALLLERRHLTVVTNALDVAQVLLDRDGIELIVLGGFVRPRMHSLLGHLTALCAQEVRADRLLMSAKAIRPKTGLMNDYVPEVLTDRALSSVADSVTVLADATKFARTASAFVFGMDTVDEVVTDRRLPARTRAELEACDIRVVIADEEAGA